MMSHATILRTITELKKRWFLKHLPLLIRDKKLKILRNQAKKTRLSLLKSSSRLRLPIKKLKTRSLLLRFQGPASCNTTHPNT